jgi:hypothetical protein
MFNLRHGPVPMPPLRLGEYRLDVEPVVSRARSGRGSRLTGVRLRVSDPDGTRVTMDSPLCTT